MKTVHYFASKSNKFVIIGENGKFTHASPKMSVSGKREANKLAIKLMAKPWNF